MVVALINIEYKTGFGDLSTAFWTSNDRVSKWTKVKEYALRIDLCTLKEDYVENLMEIEIENDFSEATDEEV